MYLNPIKDWVLLFRFFKPLSRCGHQTLILSFKPLSWLLFISFSFLLFLFLSFAFFCFLFLNPYRGSGALSFVFLNPNRVMGKDMRFWCSNFTSFKICFFLLTMITQISNPEILDSGARILPRLKFAFFFSQ